MTTIVSSAPEVHLATKVDIDKIRVSRIEVSQAEVNATEASGVDLSGVDLSGVDLSGPWVWRGNGDRKAHLIRERSVHSSTPWTLCRRRLRRPRQAWNGFCGACRDLAASHHL